MAAFGVDGCLALQCFVQQVGAASRLARVSTPCHFSTRARLASVTEPSLKSCLVLPRFCNRRITVPPQDINDPSCPLLLWKSFQQSFRNLPEHAPPEPHLCNETHATNNRLPWPCSFQRPRWPASNRPTASASRPPTARTRPSDILGRPPRLGSRNGESRRTATLLSAFAGLLPACPNPFHAVNRAALLLGGLAFYYYNFVIFFISCSWLLSFFIFPVAPAPAPARWQDV